MITLHSKNTWNFRESKTRWPTIRMNAARFYLTLMVARPLKNEKKIEHIYTLK
jgi:hypothetical protein